MLMIKNVEGKKGIRRIQVLEHNARMVLNCPHLRRHTISLLNTTVSFNGYNVV
jgi:hypothetical protein